MTSIITLPNELLLNIFEQAPGTFGDRLSTFAALCRTSRRFNTLARPLLYQVYSNKGRGTHLLHIFPFTLTQQPYLARLVQKMDLHLGGGPGDHWDVNPMPEDIYRRLRQCIQVFSRRECVVEVWSRCLSHDGLPRAQACATLALFLASESLEDLTLRYCQSEKPSWRNDTRFPTDNLALLVMRDLLLQPKDASTRFSKLQSITILRPDWRACFPLYPLAFIFRIASLRYLELCGCVQNEMDWDDWNLVSDSPIETLLLRQCDIKHQVLHLLLSRCRALKHFRFDMTIIDSQPLLFDWGVLDSGLRLHVHSLETLHISFTTMSALFRWGNGKTSTRRGALTSLRHFTKLRAIRGPTGLFVPDPRDRHPPKFRALAQRMRELLPPSATKLSIDYYDTTVGDWEAQDGDNVCRRSPPTPTSALES